MRKIEVFPAEPQGAWGWPVAANFIMVGAGTGFYLFSLIVTGLEERPFAMFNQVPYGLLAPVLAIVGFLALTTEVGRPLRGIYLLSNLRQAWVSRETLLFSVFVPLAFLDWFIQYPVIRVLTIAAALALMISQGAVLYQVRAITGWNVLVMPVFFIASGFASGGGVFLLISGLTRSPLMLSAIIILITALSSNLVIWLLYLYRFRSAAFREAIVKLRSPLNLIITVGLGHILPLILLCSLTERNYYELERSYLVEIVTGAAILMGVMIQKNAVVLRASNVKAILMGAFKN